MDVLVFAETKLDESFQDAQFSIPGFIKPYRLDISGNSGGLLVFVNESIPSKKLDGVTLPSEIQAIPIELNLRKTKWLLLPIYRPPCQNEYVFHDHIEKMIDFYSRSIDNMLIFGDFNMETTHPVMTDFLENHNLYSMIKTPTCFKSVRGRCIDLMLTNSKNSFFGSQTFETGFSDFHHLIYTILKTTYIKLPPKKIKFRDYKKFSEQNFRNDLARNLSKSTHENLGDFEKTFATTLQKHAPYKSVLVRGNNQPHITKNLRKAMMKRTRLKTIANKTRADGDIRNYKSQRNLVVKMNSQATKASAKENQF